MLGIYKFLIYDVRDSVASITFNRPDSGNAFVKESYVEIQTALNEAGKDPGARAVVITGAGKHFSAGGDIRRFKELIASGVLIEAENVRAAGRMAAAAKACPKPVIAMINGAAAGAGCSLALACDFRIMTSKSKLVMAFVKMGLSGDTGGLYFLERLVGMGKTAEMMMTGSPICGEEALSIGLASKLAEEDKLEEKTYAFARELAAMPTAAIARQKKLMWETFYADLDAYIEKEAVYMEECSRTSDFAEAVDAFLEKRVPVFRGN